MPLSRLNYDSPTRPDDAHSVPVRADALLYQGKILALDAQGYGVEAEDAAALTILGRISADVDATDRADGEVKVVFDLGVFGYENSSDSPVLDSHYGRPVFIEDDTTVRADPGDHNVFAGFCRGFTGRQVWVDMRVLPLIATFWGDNANSNYRYSVNADRGLVLQLWNQTQNTWQTVQLEGADGLERLLIA